MRFSIASLSSFAAEWWPSTIIECCLTIDFLVPRLWLDPRSIKLPRRDERSSILPVFLLDCLLFVVRLVFLLDPYAWLPFRTSLSGVLGVAKPPIGVPNLLMLPCAVIA